MNIIETVKKWCGWKPVIATRNEQAPAAPYVPTPPRTVDDWDKYFLGLCVGVSGRSKDPSTQVGAIIVDEKHQIVSTGYNGGCRKIPDHLIDWKRPNKYTWIIHAEENALWTALREVDGFTLYVTGTPCSRCMLRIAHNGISKIVYGRQKIHCVNQEDWELSCKMAEMAGVELKEIV